MPDTTQRNRDLEAGDQRPRAWRDAPDGVNVHGVERLASGLLGTVLVATGARRGSMGGLLAALAGAGLLYRGVTGHCHVYQALGVSSAPDIPRSSDHADPKLARVQRTITIGRSAEHLYGRWREPETLRQVMAHFARIDIGPDGGWHWQMRTPLGKVFEWTSYIVEERPGEYLLWRSAEDAPLWNEGMVVFSPAPGERGTRVRLAMSFRPPGGAVAAAAARVLNVVPATLALKALQRFKNLVETGEIASNESPSARTSDPAHQHVLATSNVAQDSVSRGLGWFSIGLGLAELAAPRRLASVAGLPDRPLLLRMLGLREIGSGLGILIQRNRAPWLWSRVAGDAMDLALLGAALRSPKSSRARVGGAAAAVMAITALDAVSGWRESGLPRPGTRRDNGRTDESSRA